MLPKSYVYLPHHNMRSMKILSNIQLVRVAKMVGDGFFRALCVPAVFSWFVLCQSAQSNGWHNVLSIQTYNI